MIGPEQTEFFFAAAIASGSTPVLQVGTMSKLGARPATRPAPGAQGPPPAEAALVAAFNDLRDELVSTLMFLLGNRDDAQDAAQEAFLKCWRARATLGEVQNLRAWIF